MKLEYSTLISPYPLYLDKIGNVKSPTLKEIWNPRITYPRYNLYLKLLMMTPQAYHEQAELVSANLQNDMGRKENLNMFDLIAYNQDLQESYTDVFEFFFVEHVVWNSEYQLFLLYQDVDENGQIIPVGTIQKNIFTELCDVILQRCGINRSDADTDSSQVKSKKALEILKKIQKGKKNLAKNAKYDKDMELPNLIASVAVKSNSINFTNIWDLTVFQLYEQFKREQTNVYFDIQKMSVAAYGNSKDTFKGNEWYKL